MIFVIDDDVVMARCVARAVRKAGEEVKIFTNAIEAMAAVDEGAPKMILMEILLTGPDGFAFLNELISYPDTAKIPVVIISGLDFSRAELRAYNVVGVLKKEEMRPEEITELVRKYAGDTEMMRGAVKIAERG